MKTRNWNLVAIFLLAGGIFYVSAQDMVVFRDGNMIEAKVLEISPSEIRYKRFDYLDGPVIVVPAASVLSVRYENGNYEIINADAAPQPADTQSKKPIYTAPKPVNADPNKFIFGINANAGGALGYLIGGSGAGVTIELGKGNFNSEIHLMIPIGGFGLLATFNRFWPSNIGGFYLGGGIGSAVYDEGWSLTAGLNAGYKFVMKSGLYFCTGGFVGFDFGWIWWDARLPVYIKPDLAIGWTMK